MGRTGTGRTLRGRVAVVGIGETEYYRHGASPDPEFKLALKAILSACTDAGPDRVKSTASYSDDRSEASRLAAALCCIFRRRSSLRRVKESNWAPLQFLASPTNPVKTVLEPAGFENAQGIITTQFTKQAGDPAWADDPEGKEYIEFMKKWVPNDNPGDFVTLSGYVTAQGIAHALTQCGDDLTRENLLKQATSLRGQHFKIMLPGIQFNTTPEDYAPYQSLRMAKFEGSSWKLIDDSGTSASAK
jgi:hypothetical protein